MKITQVLGYQVLDSRGRPTVAAAIWLSDGSNHTARVPSGASTGRHEAKELRDAGTSRSERFYLGHSVFSAVANINQIIAPALVGKEIELFEVDSLLEKLDPSQSHQVLGANATLAVSLAALKAIAHQSKQSIARFLQPTGELLIPMPMVNILSGGAHAGRALDIQDVLIVPVGAKDFTEGLSWVVAIREAAARLGAKSGQVTHLVADEGGLGISFASIGDACEFIIRCVAEVGLVAKEQVSIALDLAATQFYINGRYELITESSSYASSEFVNHMNNLVRSLPIVSIEDPFAEDDWQSWQEFKRKAPTELQIIGDDLFTTNLARLEMGIGESSANAILIKPNQNGLVTRTAEVLKLAKRNEFRTIVSARSGESEDSWLADLAVGWQAGQIKVGSTHGSERTAKWNRLLELEVTEKTRFCNPFNPANEREN